MIPKTFSPSESVFKIKLYVVVAGVPFIRGLQAVVKNEYLLSAKRKGRRKLKESIGKTVGNEYSVQQWNGGVGGKPEIDRGTK